MKFILTILRTELALGFAFAFAFAFALVAITACTQRAELGSKENPITIALTPGKDIASLQMSGDKMKDFLEQDTGLKFQVTVPPSYVAVVETIGSKRSDMAIMNTVGYLLANQKYQAHAIFTLTNQGRAHYKGQIITRVDGLKNLKAIHGKKFAFSDPLSASGHFLPAKLLKENHITPKNVVFAGRHDAVIGMVYQKQVDAGATFWLPDENGQPADARRLVLTQFPDIFEKTKILAYTEELPNEAFTVRNNFPENLLLKISASLQKWLSTAAGRASFKELYNCDGLKPATDKDYDGARLVIESLGKRIQEL